MKDDFRGTFRDTFIFEAPINVDSRREVGNDLRWQVSKWPNVDKAKEFWDSDEYKEVKKLREGAGEFRIMLLEGLEKDDLS